MSSKGAARGASAPRPSITAQLSWATRFGFLALSACGETTHTDAFHGSVAKESSETPSPHADDDDVPSGPDAAPDLAGQDLAALVNNALWTPVEADRDPFEDGPPSVVCPEGSFGSEPLGGLLTFYVDSGRCNYVTVAQPSRAPIVEGDQVNVRFKHFPLTGPDGAAAHLAFMLGDILIAERNVSIPADDREYDVVFTATEAVEEGTPVYFHAHNHGQNEYSVLSIHVLPRP